MYSCDNQNTVLELYVLTYVYSVPNLSTLSVHENRHYSLLNIRRFLLIHHCLIDLSDFAKLFLEPKSWNKNILLTTQSLKPFEVCLFQIKKIIKTFLEIQIATNEADNKCRQIQYQHRECWIYQMQWNIAKFSSKFYLKDQAFNIWVSKLQQKHFNQ